MRYPMLDVLRTVAILLVLGRHLPNEVQQDVIATAFFSGGWTGVDLFFCLSGFLVSSLLFREYAETGSVRIGRFLVRRGLKIYPAFYVFLATSIIAALPFVWREAIVAEALFVTNYSHLFGNAKIWDHTWSLAVEEHFYLGLAMLVTVLVWLRRRDPFLPIPLIVAAVAAGCLAARIAGHPANIREAWMPTHLRIDSLVAGVGIAWAVHRWPGFLTRLAPHRSWLFVAGLLCFVPQFFPVVTEHHYTWTVGFTVLYIGAGCLVLWALTAGPLGPIGKAMAYVGAHSYSIYLWHLAVLDWALRPYLLDRLSGQPWLFVAIYVALCLAVGILMSLLVEYPVLHLRDRWFPSRS